MNPYPIVGANLSQMLFQKEEKSITPSNQAMYKNVSSFYKDVQIPSESVEMATVMPAYITQSRISTYYQDNPWGTLMFNEKYGVEPMGGSVNMSQPPGYRPGNIRNNK